MKSKMNRTIRKSLKAKNNPIFRVVELDDVDAPKYDRSSSTTKISSK